MKYFHFLIVLVSIIAWSSCRKDFDTETVSAGGIEFSADTIFFDTIFSGVQSNTQVLKIFNRSNNDINIPLISFKKGTASRYTMSVDGLPFAGTELSDTNSSGKIFEDIPILANDSIFVFIETTINALTDDLENSFYNDEIIFFNQTEDVNLITLVKDATFIFRDATDTEEPFETKQRNQKGEFITITGFDLEGDELTMNNKKAYVINGNVVVPNGQTLTIEAGARLHFSEDSGLIIEDGGSLQINGTVSPADNPELNQVIIEGDRIAEDFDNLPGQWGQIWFRKGATGNISNTTIKNGSIGILIDGNGNEAIPSLELNNVQIYNSEAAGIQANATNINATNVVINQSGITSLNIEQGGTYNFTHCTLANFFNFGGGIQRAISISNTVSENNSVTDTNLETANFTNCIIAGDNRQELNLKNDNVSSFNFLFQNCLIDLNSTTLTSDIPEFNFEDTSLYNNCIFNEDPNFRNTRLNFMQIGEESAANETASIITGNDITGTTRSSTKPDIGAYESIIFEKEEEEK